MIVTFMLTSTVTIQDVSALLSNYQPIKLIIERFKTDNSVLLSNIAGSFNSFLSIELSNNFSSILFIVDTRHEAEQLADDCEKLFSDGRVILFTESAHQPHALDILGNRQQLEALCNLQSSNHFILCTHISALVSKLPLPIEFSKKVLRVEQGNEIGFSKLIESLQSVGFQIEDFVAEPGDYAVRGGIIDVFPSVGDNPIRLEFWGDTLESIREFDVLSQRSIRELTVATIIPNLFSSLLQNDYAGSIFDYLPEHTHIISPDERILASLFNELHMEMDPQSFTPEEIITRLKKFHIAWILPFTQQSDGMIDLGARPQPAFNGSVHNFKKYLLSLSNDGYKTIIFSDSPDEATRLQELLTDIDQEKELSTIYFCTDALHRGFILPDLRCAFLTEHEVFGRLIRRAVTKKKRFKGLSQKEFSQLQRGDFVVHVDHGIGKFSGLQKISIQDVEQEVARLLYADDDVLFVNLNYINRIQKYSSQESHVPALHKLGAMDWERLKQRTKRRIKDIARDLIKLYAKRRSEKGFAFPSDSLWQKELEASFMYEDTADQATATADIKHDMQADCPMDRLICGDVGFGKTEVAVRAAFKAVMGGKQVGILVPTTILAQQHFNTFNDRLKPYAARVEVISRFRTKKEQNEILKKLQEGSINIIIGTHRLLSKDVQFKDLGLLVIDEEQRFGVSAKEKLRVKKASVDTLTLTATPIPRTLHFSLMGARDLSIINTPPRNRLPIITEIAELEPGLIREAVLRELHRHGQVFFVHDRIENMMNVVQFLQRHLPEARIRFAHGQMTGHELEKVMLDFLERKFDLLVATKIIESGLDLPNVNTIIINRADRFGLAELYQLRGRVGRANRQAYAYFLTPPISSLPKHAIRRLQAIEEFTELGSGFNLAMRDMEIRGTGNILGAEQSGFIMEMGFEMYTRILEDAIQELKQEEFEKVFDQVTLHKPSTETLIDVDIEALIPDIYIEHDSERLDVYRRLYAATEQSVVDDIRNELRDRFGNYPEEVENLFQIVQVKLLAAKAGIVKVDLLQDTLFLTLPSDAEKDFYEVREGVIPPFQRIIDRFPLLQKYKPLLIQDKIQLKIRFLIRGKTPEERLKQLRSVLETFE